MTYNLAAQEDEPSSERPTPPMSSTARLSLDTVKEGLVYAHRIPQGILNRPRRWPPSERGHQTGTRVRQPSTDAPVGWLLTPRDAPPGCAAAAAVLRSRTTARKQPSFTHHGCNLCDHPAPQAASQATLSAKARHSQQRRALPIQISLHGRSSYNSAAERKWVSGKIRPQPAGGPIVGYDLLRWNVRGQDETASPEGRCRYLYCAVPLCSQSWSGSSRSARTPRSTPLRQPEPRRRPQ